MKRSHLLILIVLILGIGAFFYFDLKQYLSLGFVQDNLNRFNAFYAENPALTLGSYFLLYVIITALSLPGAGIMTLVGGALFGLFTGLLLVSFASTIGATLAFLVSRFLLRNWVQTKFGTLFSRINQGVEKDGAFYLFTLRLVPAFPFFVINLLMGLTNIKVSTFYIVSQIGMLAGTAVYVNAGRALGNIESLGDIISPPLIGSFVLLGLFPWIARFIIRLFGKKPIEPPQT